MTISPEALEAMARTLEESGRYRVLRRLDGPRHIGGSATGIVRQGIVLDLETTGLDPRNDEIIEFGLVPFTYDAGGRILSVGEPFSRLRQPAGPISPEITRLTGLTDAMVAGQVVDPAEVAAFIASAALIVAHNAAFDRRFAEAFCPDFAFKPWACSYAQIDWRTAGFESGKLAFLAAGYGFYHEGHRASHDCLATLEILSAPLPGTGGTGFQTLLATARKTSVRIWADQAPFELKDVLKARGYRWNGEAGPAPRAWYIDVDEADRDAEIAFLSSDIYRGAVDPLTRRITAFERFSERA
ncbi:3'-5' exonuclease [Caulobacter sp. 602-2]|uniref:3'-5' exonuclease n=1 Tax=Caulobacter sp. 602-2 TaxID=2710887 RepID=A0A6G4QSD0_9CAUL|nr:3'-5' exonuclease [Caulobacter sp. 602-2]